jgi:hypothetical protein
MALGEEGHSGKALFPECNTRGREALTDEKWYLTARMDGAIFKIPFPECLILALGEGSLFLECLPLALGEGSSPSARGKHSGKNFYFFASFFVRPSHII